MIPVYLLPLFIIGTHSHIISNSNGRPQVELKNGPIEGVWRQSSTGRKYAAFEGIPYAKPPVGDLRFKEPQPAEPWMGIWNATRTYVCPQTTFDRSEGPVQGDEDCLYLNVFVPTEVDTQPMDVLVYVHGGAFMLGNSVQLMDNQYLMDKDLVLVSFNYRIGALGFLSTADDVVPGNNGLKDQQLALKWIQENIAVFGGNRESVTLTGVSAGASSVHFHYFSPQSKGLFHRGYSISGTALASWAIQSKPLETAKTLAKHVGCNISDTKTMIKCLKERPASLLVQKTKQNVYAFSPMPIAPFAPVVEKWGPNPFMDEHPYTLLKQGMVYDVPWINSIAANEGLIFTLTIEHRLEEMNQKWDTCAPHILHCDGIVPISNLSKIFEKVKEHYGSINDNQGEETNYIDSYELSKIFSDALFVVPAQRATDLQAQVTKSPAYFYVFSYEGENSMKYFMSPDSKDKGACHADDVFYVYGSTMRPMSEMDLKLRDVLMDMLYSYVTNGTPVTNGMKWEPVKDDFVYYLIGGPSNITKQVERAFESRRFWDELGLRDADNLIRKKDEL